MSLIKRSPIYFIAEIGQNHQGDLAIAKEMVDSLRGLPVSAIKTAKRDIDTCLTKEQKSMPYDNPNSFGETYYEHRKALEFSKHDFFALKQYVEEAGFDFISSYTDIPSLNYICDIGVKCLKIASQRVTDIPLLKATARKKLPVILSTGMSSIEEVDAAVEILKENELYILQCTSTYPCPENELHLNVLSTYRERYGDAAKAFGFSGHHGGIAPDLASYMLGASIIERHYTLDRAMKGTDHAVSLERRGVELILRYIEQVQEAIGSPDKCIQESEKPAIEKLRADG